MSKTVTVGVGLKDYTVQVPDNATGYEIKRGVYLDGDGLKDEILSWQLQGSGANGSNQIIGNNDSVRGHSHLDLMTIYDKA